MSSTLVWICWWCARHAAGWRCLTSLTLLPIPQALRDAQAETTSLQRQLEEAQQRITPSVPLHTQFNAHWAQLKTQKKKQQLQTFFRKQMALHAGGVFV